MERAAARELFLALLDPLERDLFERAGKVGRLVEEHRASAQASDKRRLKASITQTINELYGDADFCPEHRARVHKEAAKALRKGYDLAWFYEVLHKSILKTGCQQCPIQKRI